MPAPISDTVKALVKRDYFGGLSLHDAAKAHGVSPRKAQSWSKDESWAKLKLAAQTAPPATPPPQLVSFDRNRGQAQVVQAEVVGPVDVEAVQDLRATLDRAIARLDSAIATPYDMKNLSGLVSSLAKAVETRRRISDDIELLNQLMDRFPQPGQLVQALKDAGYVGRK